MKDLLLVAAGGATGSLARFGLQKSFNLNFPFGTLAANLLGCFLAGVMLAYLSRGLNTTAGLFLLTGFCGGFTTFSAFSVESLQLFQSGRTALFALYTLGSLAAGLTATFAGYKLFHA